MHFRYEFLFANDDIAKAAEAIVQAKGADLFCRTPDDESEPPLFSENRIEFCMKPSIVGSNGGMKGGAPSDPHFVIVDEKTFDAHGNLRPKGRRLGTRPVPNIDPDTEIDWETYGTTTAYGYEKEVASLIIWSIINDEYTLVDRMQFDADIYDIIKVSEFYEQVFGYAIDGEYLVKVLCASGDESRVLETLPYYGLEVTLDNIRFVEEKNREERIRTEIEHLVSNAARALGLGGDKRRQHSYQLLFPDLSANEVVRILTFDRVNMEEYDAYYDGTTMHDSECATELATTIGEYASLWDGFNFIANAKDLEFDKLIGKQRSGGVGRGNSPQVGYYRSDWEKAAEIQRESIMRKYETAKRVSGCGLQKVVEDFIQNNVLDVIVEAVKDGVPIEDLLA